LVRGDGPFDDFVTVYCATSLDRRQLSDNGLLAYHAHPGAPGGGCSEAYAGDCWHNSRIRYWRSDVPHWSGGDPGLGLGNPLPPLVIRHEHYAVRPRVPLAVLGAGWVAWGMLFVRHRLRLPPGGAGFEVLPAGRVEGGAGPPAA
jgi:hypothetical protein